jgi:hypothetical protein
LCREDKGIIKGLRVLPVFALILICIALALNLIYSLPLEASLLFYGGAFLCFYVPGSLLLRFLRFNKDEYFINLFHSLALGTALVPVVYAIYRRLQYSGLIYALGSLLFLAWLVFAIRDLKIGKAKIYTSFFDILSALVLLTAVFYLLHLSHFTDILFFKDGFRLRISDLTEGDFHLGIINNIKNMYPPLDPFVSGASASHYHLNMHLEIEMFNRLFSVDTLKLTFFYFPLLYFCLLVFIPYIYFRKFWDDKFIGVLSGLLMFGSDLSFIPGVAGNFNADFPWTAVFRTTIWSLFTLNGYLPAIFIMFLSLIYIKEFYKEGGKSYLIMFSLLGYASFGFKSSMGFHLMSVAFITGLISWVYTKDKRNLLMCIVSAATLLVMCAEVIYLRQGTGNIVTVDLFNGFRRSLKFLNNAGIIMDNSLVSFIIYVAAVFGIRLLGFYVIRDFFTKNINPVMIFLVIFSISGFVLAETVNIGAASGSNVNNSSWFALQSLMGAWFLLSNYLLNIRQSRKRLFVAMAIVLLSFPATFQFLSLRDSSSYDTFDSQEIEVIKYLEETPSDSVILFPPNFKGPSLAANFAGRQSVYSYYHSFVSHRKGLAEANDRLKDIALFFKSDDLNIMPLILEKYKVNYVYAPSDYAERLDRTPGLEPAVKNSRYVAYKVDL